MKTFLDYLAEEACPIATQDVHVNIKNRQHGIDEYGYGPANPDENAADNKKFWMKKAEMWNTTVDNVKTMRCHNCGAFDVSKKMLACIEKGINPEKEGTVDAMATIEASNLGYCNFIHFKCAGDRTCDIWIAGGPVTE